MRTLWGELAWQLDYAAGGASEAKKAFNRLAADDERATSPGDVLRELFVEYGPCLILIDEWVAYPAMPRASLCFFSGRISAWVEEGSLLPGPDGGVGGV